MALETLLSGTVSSAAVNRPASCRGTLRADQGTGVLVLKVCMYLYTEYCV